MPIVWLRTFFDSSYIMQVRQETVALLGRLFASSHADYGEQYRKNFREFLGRFKDINKEIRLQMVQIGCILLQRKPNLATMITGMFHIATGVVLSALIAISARRAQIETS